MHRRVRRTQQDDPVLQEARALDEAGRSREACALLAGVVEDDPEHPARELLGEWLLRDGRARRWLGIYERHAEAWSRVPRLLYMQAFALHRLGQYEAARASYVRLKVLAEDRAPDWLPFAERGIQSTDEEGALRERVGAAHSRADRLTLLGVVGLGLGCGVLWVLARRNRLARQIT